MPQVFEGIGIPAQAMTVMIVELPKRIGVRAVNCILNHPCHPEINLNQLELVVQSPQPVCSPNQLRTLKRIVPQSS
jgi:hypothetical protein